MICPEKLTSRMVLFAPSAYRVIDAASGSIETGGQSNFTSVLVMPPIYKSQAESNTTKLSAMGIIPVCVWIVVIFGLLIIIFISQFLMLFLDSITLFFLLSGNASVIVNGFSRFC